jgi:hypothetical protein
MSLTASDYGLYNLVGGVVVMMALLNTVMTTTSFRFIGYEMGKGLDGALTGYLMSVSFFMKILI